MQRKPEIRYCFVSLSLWYVVHVLFYQYYLMVHVLCRISIWQQFISELKHFHFMNQAFPKTISLLTWQKGESDKIEKLNFFLGIISPFFILWFTQNFWKVFRKVGRNQKLPHFGISRHDLRANRGLGLLSWLHVEIFWANMFIRPVVMMEVEILLGKYAVWPFCQT